MATFEEIKKQLEKAEEKLEKAEEKLEEWEEGEDDGKWLKELRRKSRRNDLSEKEEQEKARLEKKEEKLEKRRNGWEEQMLYLQKKTAEFNEKGNEQIHKKYFIYLFGILFTTLNNLCFFYFVFSCKTQA